MKSIVKNLIFAGSGLIIGGIGGFLGCRLYSKKILVQEYDKGFLDGQNDILEQQYDSALGDEEDERNIKPMDFDDEDEHEVVEFIAPDKLINEIEEGVNAKPFDIHVAEGFKAGITETADRITNIFDEAKKNMKNYKNLTVDEKAELEHPEDESDTKDIEIITEDEFHETALHHGKEYLIYYDEDDVLTDDDGYPIPDIEDSVGDSCSRFGEKCDSPNMVYVRNHKEGVDYEITRVRESYSSKMFNVDDDYDDLGHSHRRRRDDFD